MSCHWMLLITWWWMSHFTNEMGGLAVRHLICFLFGMNPLLWIESVRRILHHGHHGSKTIFIDCHGNQVSGYGLRLAEQGAIAWVWFCSMGIEGMLDILPSGSSCGHVSGGGTLWQCPAIEPPDQKVLLKKIVLSPLAFSFQPDFQVWFFSTCQARDMSSVNSSFGWHSQSWYSSCNQKLSPISAIRELVQGP